MELKESMNLEKQKDVSERRSEIGLNYNPNTILSDPARLSAFARNPSSIGNKQISEKSVTENSGLTDNVSSTKKKAKTISASNKRTPAKKTTSKTDYIPNKYKGDGKEDDDEGEDEEGDDEDEEDPDLALFLDRKKSGISSNIQNKSQSKPIGSSSISPNMHKPGNTFDFKPVISGLGNTSAINTPNLMKMKSMKEVEKSIVQSTPSSIFKTEELKLPGAETLQNRLNDKSTFSPLTNTNLIKFDTILPKGENLKRDEKVENDSENLDDISLSSQNFDTEDQLYCQYIKVNRTKQRYRCEFVDVIIHHQGTDYVLRKLYGEINGEK